MHRFFARHLLLLPAFASLLSAGTLVDEPFDNPTDITYQYPSPPGDTPSFHGNFSGWAAKDGLISVTYGAALGKFKTGGMLCTVDKPSATFMAVQYEKVRLPITDPAYATTEQLKRYQLEFDAKLPAGRELVVYLNPIGPQALQSRQWAGRLILGRVTGTGEYARYSLPASAASPAAIGAFLQFIRDAHLNGAESTEVTLTWLFPIKDQAWQPGEAIQLDNIRFGTEG